MQVFSSPTILPLPRREIACTEKTPPDTRRVMNSAYKFEYFQLFWIKVFRVRF